MKLLEPPRQLNSENGKFEGSQQPAAAILATAVLILATAGSLTQQLPQLLILAPNLQDLRTHFQQGRVLQQVRKPILINLLALALFLQQRHRQR